MCPIFVPSSTHFRNVKLFQHVAVFSKAANRNSEFQTNINALEK
jgi:hypothetical protein